MTSALRRTTVAAGAALAALALSAGPAGAAVPRAKWYWTLVVAPSSPRTLLLGTDDGVYRSTDGGRAWRRDGFAGVNATSLVDDGSTIFVAGDRTVAGKAPVVSRHGIYSATGGAPVFAESTNGGTTWQSLHPRGLPRAVVQALAADPLSPHVLYAVVVGGALYRSSDDGSSFRLWAPRLGGPPWALAVTEQSRLVAGDMTTGSYVSANGKAWQHTPFVDPKGSKMVMEYAARPGSPKRVLMTSYGVLVSTDGGATWRVSLKSKVMFGPVAWAPGSPDVAYAVGFDRSVWRTSDGGASWTRAG